MSQEKAHDVIPLGPDARPEDQDEAPALDEDVENLSEDGTASTAGEDEAVSVEDVDEGESLAGEDVEDLDAPAAAPSEEQLEESPDPLHIGNLIGILSDAYGYTVGRVVYRDLEMVRVVPQEASDRAVEFPLAEGGSSFIPELGVGTVELLEIQPSDYYVDFLGARPGEILEFFTTEGTEAAPSGEVAEVIKSKSKDSIRLTDGRVLKFRGIGPQEPIAVIRVRTAANMPAATAAAAGGPTAEETEAVASRAARQSEMLSLLRSVLPAATVEVIPTAERSYPDSMQREDMFQDLLASVSEKKRTNQRRIRAIEREVDIMVSLKNKSLIRAESGVVIGPAPHAIVTIKDALSFSTKALPAAIPIVEAALVLNLDRNEGGNFKATDVAPRVLSDVETQSEDLAQLYETGKALPAEVGLGFFAYTQHLLGQDQAVLRGPAGNPWSADQDVLRTAGPDVAVQGLSTGLPSGNSFDLAGEDGIYVSLAMLISNTTNRSVRVLTEDTYFHHKSGDEEVVAPSDPATVSGYVILPPKAAMALRPPAHYGEMQSWLHYSDLIQEAPSLSDVLRDLHTVEVGSPLHAWTLTLEAAATTTVADWLSSVLRYVIHPLDALAPRTPRMMALLDTLGLGTMDLTQDLTNVLSEFIKTSQKTWRSLLKERREEIQKALDAEPPRTYQTVTGPDATLWSSLLTSASLKELLADITRRNPSIAEAPTLLAASLLTEAQGDATPLVWSEIARLDGRPAIEGLDAAAAAESLAKSRSYSLRSKALKARNLLALAATAPVKSTCTHAERLEAVRNVTDVLQRSRLLRDFIEEFQGPKSGNWMTCIICKQNCVCYHELMELEALAQPSRLVAIQKQILVKFGGGRQGRQIVCKNCGLGLQDIDYDDHVEFDDDGRPIASSSVLTQEQIESVGDSSWQRIAATVTAAPVSNSVSFATEGQRDLGDALTIILDRAGLQADAEVIRRIVRYADLYVSLRAPPQGAYEMQRSRMLTSASTKIKVSSGPLGTVVDVPTYAALLDQLRVSALIALTTLSLQVATPPILVNNPLPICTFSRAGYPFDPSKKPEDVGALAYISCVVASIQRDSVPWRNMKWAGEPKIEPRKREALKLGFIAMQIILGADAKSAPLSFTPEIRQMLTRAQTDVVAAKERALVSLTDELPVGFRPEPFPAKMERPSIERDPLPPIRASLVAGESVAAMIPPISGAMHQDAIASVGLLHEMATAAVAIAKAAGQKPVMDATCCPVRFADLRPLEQGSLVKAHNLLRSSIPTETNAGTHLWPTYETPVPHPVDQNVEESVLFKLFLKFCYSGPIVGEPHEFSTGSICRSCGLALGKPMDLIDFASEGPAILAAQQGRLRVEVTRASFSALSEAIRRRRIMMAPDPLRSQPSYLIGLRAFSAIARDTSPSGAVFADQLDPILAGLVREGMGPVDEIARAEQWESFSQYSIGLRNEIGDKIGPLQAPGPGRQEVARAREAQAAMAMFDTMTEDAFGEGPRALQEYWCSKVASAGLTYSVKDVRAALWSKISKKHDDMISKLVSTNYAWYGGTLTEVTKKVLLTISKTIGPILRAWISQVRPSTSPAGTSFWTISEAQLVLRTLVLQAWRDAVMTASPVYSEIADPMKREAASAAVADWSRSLMVHVKNQFVRFSKEAVKRILQDRAQLERETIVGEFEAIGDDDERAAELIKKTLKIGRWAGGANVKKLDADQFEFEAEQRHRMGIVDAPVDPILLEGAAAPPAAEDFGLGGANAGPEDGYDGNQAADGDDY